MSDWYEGSRRVKSERRKTARDRARDCTHVWSVVRSQAGTVLGRVCFLCRSIESFAAMAKRETAAQRRREQAATRVEREREQAARWDHAHEMVTWRCRRLACEVAQSLPRWRAGRKLWCSDVCRHACRAGEAVREVAP